MKSWNLNEIPVEPRKPKVIGTKSEGRAILFYLPSGESLDRHQVRERAVIVVNHGRIEVTDRDGNTTRGPAGTMFVFEPDEPHSVVAEVDSRFLLLLAPWSLDEHSSMDPWHRSD